MALRPLKLFIFVLYYVRSIDADVDEAFITGCKGTKGSKEVELCLKKMLHKYLYIVTDEMPRVNLPVIDPVFVGDIHVDSGNDNFHTKGTLQATLRGASTIHVPDIKVDYGTNKFYASASFDDFFVNGKYVLRTIMKPLEVRGNSTYWLDLGGLKADVDMEFFILLVDNTPRLQIRNTHFDINIDCDAFRFRFNDIIDGDGTLDNAVNMMLLEHRCEFVEVITPALQDAIIEFAETMCNRALLTIDIDAMGGAEDLRRAFHL